MIFGVGVLCILYFFVCYLYVSGNGSITSVGEERAYLSCYCLLAIKWFLLEWFPLPLGVLDGLRYFNVTLPAPSI